MIKQFKEKKVSYYYDTDNYFEYPIGRVLEYFTNKMVSYGITFETYKVDEIGNDGNKIYRPHHKTYPYINHIIYMYMGGNYGYSEDTYKLYFYPSHTLSYEQAKKITSIFCNHDDCFQTNNHGNIINGKIWLEYLRFQIPIEKEIKKLIEVLGIRIIVEFRLNQFLAELRKEKIKKLLNE